MISAGGIDFLDKYGNQIGEVRELYPNFEVWFANKVIPGLHDGSRLLLIAEGGARFSGFTIAKRDQEERKLCTLWVQEGFRRQGIATQLLVDACSWLETDKPLASILQESSQGTGSFLERRGFVQTSTKKNPTTGLIEIFYNE